MKQILAFLLIFLSFSLIAQTQIGGEINGNSTGDRFGSSVTLSADGSRLAVGASYDNAPVGTGIPGYVKIYDKINGQWSQIGSDLGVGEEDDSFGRSIALSADGKKIAIGAPQTTVNDVSNAGIVRVYEEIDGMWSQLGNDLVGFESGIRVGYSVSLSADGTILAFGIPNVGDLVGQVKVYEEIDGVWTQTTAPIAGIGTGARFGWAISLSSDGSRLAIGARSGDDSAENAGQVKIYARNGSVWSQIGESINGDNSGDTFGASVSISADGTRIAIGAPGYDNEINNEGQVKIFEETEGEWIQVGNNLTGQSENNGFGNSVSLSDDGKRLSVGEPGGDETGSNSGSVKLFDEISGEWSQVGNTISGNSENNFFGISVALSADGKYTVGGATAANGTGQARVFGNLSTSLETLNHDNISIYPNPTSANIFIEGTENGANYKVISLTGQTIQEGRTQNQLINLTALNAGLYILKIETNTGLSSAKVLKY